jgi:hypothetical protein
MTAASVARLGGNDDREKIGIPTLMIEAEMSGILSRKNGESWEKALVLYGAVQKDVLLLEER